MDFKYLFRAVIVGDSGVGKTSFLRKLAEVDLVLPRDGSRVSGPDFVDTEFDMSGKVNLRTWDQTTQSRYRVVDNGFYGGSHAVFLMFDIGKKETFRSIVHKRLPEAKKSVRDNTTLILLGNKYDHKNDGDEGDEVDAECVMDVSEDEAAEFASTHSNMIFFLVSARTGWNLQHVVTECALMCIQKDERLIQTRTKKNSCCSIL